MSKPSPKNNDFRKECIDIWTKRVTLGNADKNTECPACHEDEQRRIIAAKELGLADEDEIEECSCCPMRHGFNTWNDSKTEHCCTGSLPNETYKRTWYELWATAKTCDDRIKFAAKMLDNIYESWEEV